MDQAPAPSIASGLRLIPDASPIVAALVRRGDSSHTRRAYKSDLGTYATWLSGEGIGWLTASVDDLDRYREWLAQRYARSTVNRRLSVVRGLYAEAERRGVITSPASRLRGLRGRDERDGGALTLGEAADVLESIRRSMRRPRLRIIGMRDLALVSLLIRTGLRRAELASLRVGSIGSAQGHHTMSVAGKGAVARTVKLPVDVWRTLVGWLEVAAETGVELASTDPLFVAIRKGGRIVSRAPLSERAIHAVVARRHAAAGLPALGPHALRATFVTLALEGGAPLHLVQHAVGHADPRTTERYWRRKASLDDNAVDYVRL
jgi:site-specific recombinase XerD